MEHISKGYPMGLKNRRFGMAVLLCLAVLFLSLAGVMPARAKDEKIQAPKEYGVYAKTAQGLKRILPNIVFDEKGLLYVVSNNPQRFLLKDIEYFLVYGKYDTQYLTMNPLLFVAQDRLGKVRYMFGKEVPIETAKKGTDLYLVKPKGLFGRGYFSLWIHDTAWDLVIE
jgi:hypothetical protein